MRLVKQIAVLVAAAAATFGAATAAGRTGGDHGRAAQQPHFASRAEAALNLVSRATRSSDAVPEHVVKSALLADGFANVAEARQADAPGVRPVWVMPGRDETMCFVTPGAMNCPKTESVLALGAAPFVFWHADEPIQVAGLAVDGVDEVVLRTEDGRRVRSTVTDNVFRLSTTSAPVSLTWTHAGTARSYEFALPDEARD